MLTKMNMESSILLPSPKIKIEDDASDVIDLDRDRTPEDLVYEWHSKVCMKIKTFVVESEGSLDSLMKWYIQLLKDEAVNLEDCQTLKMFAAKHVQLFKLYFVELNCCFVDNYLDNMEEILTIYTSVEVKSLPRKQKDSNKRVYRKFLSSVCRKIICFLNLYLLHREDRMYHVMMKIKPNLLLEECKELLNLLYGKLLTKEPKDKSDLGFCRSYILYQKWKTIRKSDDWEEMDAVMYKLYDRTPESVKTNETLKSILLPQNNSVLDTLIHVTEKTTILSDTYFKFISSIKLQDENVILPEISDIEINDPISAHLEADKEDEEFNKAYNNFLKSMSTLSQAKTDAAADESVAIKVEDDDDDDCQIVGVSSIGCESEDMDLIHELLDDDIEIIYCKKKEQQRASQKERTAVSFLESINIPDPSVVSREKVSSQSPYLLASQSSVVNSVTTSAVISVLEKLDTLLCEPSTEKFNVSRPSGITLNVGDRREIDLPLNTDMESQCVPRVTKILSNTQSSRHPAEPGPVKSLITTETQTDDITQIISAGNLGNCQCHRKDMDTPESSDKQDSMCTGYYYYGLVTPPSDQPSDEHNAPATDSNTYSNVYANIVRTHNSQDEADSSAKASESDYLPPLIEGSNLEDKSRPASYEINTVGNFSQAPIEQNTYNKDQSHLRGEDSNMSFEMEFESNTETRVKEISSSVKNAVGEPEDHSNICNSTPNLKEVTTEEEVLDDSEQRANVSKTVTLDERHNHDSNLVSESCPTPEVTQKLPESSTLYSSTNICRSSGTYSSSSIPITFSDTVSSPSSPNKCKDTLQAPNVSPSVPCTSTEFIVTSQDFPSTSSKISSSIVENVPCPSPDITSTSTDVQDFNKSFPSEGKPGDNRVAYGNLSSNVSDSEDAYLNNENYSEEYLDYSECNTGSGDFINNENVSQSNLEDGGGEDIFIEDPVLMNNSDELSFIIGEALPIGANVNISIDNHCDESSIHSDVSSPSNNVDNYEIKQSEVAEENEKVNSEKSKKSFVTLKELKVAVEKINMNNGDHKINNTKVNKRKVMFTSSEKVEKSCIDNCPEQEETSNLRWDNLTVVHSLEEVLTGPISKVNGVNSSINPDTNFDLFSSKPSPTCVERSSETPPNSSINSSGDVTSPAYEGMDDFRTYFEENKNNKMLGMSSPHKSLTEDKIVNCEVVLERHPFKNNKDLNISPKGLKCLQNNEASPHKATDESVPITDTNDKEKSLRIKPQNNGKRMRIAFAENIIDSSNIVSHSPTENPNGVLQSILKKSSSDGENIRMNSKRITRPRIPRRLMNLKSLAQFNVKPNDPCIQGVPWVIVERLSDSEISQWLRVSEISRKIRLQKQRAQFASSQSIFRVDYDKQTSHINENDVVRYNTPEAATVLSIPPILGHWRSNSILHTKSSKLDEGFNSNDLPYTEKKNGKRKRQNSFSFNSQNSKKPPGRPRKKV